jgi:hypothetical protein
VHEPRDFVDGVRSERFSREALEGRWAMQKVEKTRMREGEWMRVWRPS